MAENPAFAGSGIATGDLGRAGAVPAAEQRGVDEQRVQLVESDSVGPSVGER
jgi:hypothetical protein